jgi:hypothetical protein
MAKEWPSWRDWRKWTPNPRPGDDTSAFQEHRNWLNLRVVLLITRFTPRCPEVIRLLSLGMDSPLPLTTRLKLRVHYLMCSFCERYAKQLKYMRTTAHEFPQKIGEISDATLPTDVKKRMKDALKS